MALATKDHAIDISERRQHHGPSAVKRISIVGLIVAMNAVAISALVLIVIVRDQMATRDQVNDLNKKVDNLFAQLLASPPPPARSYDVATLKSLGVIPDVVSAFTPLADLTVAYHGVVTQLGQEMTPASMFNPPTLALAPSKPDALYTLIMTDPDAPSRTEHYLGEFVHWVVVNAPAENLPNGTIVAGYIGPGPPYNSGLHRYTFVVFEQPAPLTEAAIANATSYFTPRARLDVESWAAAAGLGEPAAVDVIQSQWDRSVDALHAQLGFVPPDPYKSPSQQAQVREQASNSAN